MVSGAAGDPEFLAQPGVECREGCAIADRERAVEARLELRCSLVERTGRLRGERVRAVRDDEQRARFLGRVEVGAQVAADADAVVGSCVRGEDAHLQLGVRRGILAQPPGDQRGERKVGIDGPARPLTQRDLEVDTEAAERPPCVGWHRRLLLIDTDDGPGPRVRAQRRHDVERRRAQRLGVLRSARRRVRAPGSGARQRAPRR